MHTFKKILVPTDFSENAISAYTHAQAIANKFNAKVDFIHIIPVLKYFSESLSKLGMPFDMDDDLYPHVQKEAKHRLETAMNDYLKDENKGKAIVQIDRKPSEAIAGYGKSGGYDMIVMASCGGHDSDLLRGSVTEKVIRYSSVPVFAVDARLSAEGLKRILVPTDVSGVSFVSIPLAATLANLYEAEITLFHVLELHGSKSESMLMNPEKTEAQNIYNSIISGLSKYLNQYKGGDIELRRLDAGFEDQLVLTDGGSSRTITLHTVIKKAVSAHYGIEDYATDHADIVVLATHGHTGLAHLFLGSTAEKVTRYMDLPVVTVKPGKD